MASPFKIFRKNQKVMYAFLVIVAMIAFVSSEITGEVTVIRTWAPWSRRRPNSAICMSIRSV